MTYNKEVVVVGAGLAGSEAAYQLAKRGIKVKLYEMKKIKKTEAHKSDDFAELVCSNSLGADNLANASGAILGQAETSTAPLATFIEKAIQVGNPHSLQFFFGVNLKI